MRLPNKLKELFPTHWQYRIDLNRCARAQSRIEKTRPPRTRAAYDSGAMHSYWADMSELYEWRRSLITDNFRRQAAKLSVPMPDYNDGKMWELVENETTQDGTRCLTTAGEHAVIATIREAEKHRREIKVFWLTWLTSIGGIVIGIVSVWPKN